MIQRSDFDQDTPHLIALEGTKEEATSFSALVEIGTQKRSISSQRVTVARRAAYILTALLVLTCIGSIFFLTVDLPLLRLLLWIWAISAGIFIIVGLRIDPMKRGIALQSKKKGK